MKMSLPVSLAAVMLSCAFEALAVVSENLIANGDFETLLKDGHPKGYSRVPEYSGALSSTSSFGVTTNAYAGRHAGLYACNNRGGFISYYGIRTRPHTWYRFSGMIATDVDPVMDSTKRSVPPPGVFVQLMANTSAQDRWAGRVKRFESQRLYAGGGESDWTEYRRYFRTDEITNLWFGIYIMNVSGSARFDDLALVETTEDEAKAWARKESGTDVPDGVNILINGSFELAGNDDMPDFIYTGVGAPWFEDTWPQRRVAAADAPFGGHWFHTTYYMSWKVAGDTNRDMRVSFYARAAGEGSRKISAGFNGTWADFTLTDEWTRYSFLPKRGKGGRLNVSRKSKTGAAFDLDGVMIQFGTNEVAYADDPNDAFFAEHAARQRRKGEALNAQVADAAFSGPLAVPPPERDGKLAIRFDTVFAGEGAEVRGFVAEDARELVVTNAAGRSSAWKFSADALAKGVRFGTELPAGDYGLKGVPYGFRVVPPPKDGRWCRVDRFAHMAFTERGPYFPCAFSMAMAAKFAGHLPEVKENGFNTVLFWGYGVDRKTRYDAFDPAVARPILDACASNGLAAISFTPVMKPDDHFRMLNDKSVPKVFAWEVRQNPFGVVNEAKLGFARAFSDHPAVRMLHYYDEVYGYWEAKPCPKAEADIATTYRMARAADPYRLHWNNSSYCGRIYGGPFSTDVISATIYTIRYVGGAPATVASGDALVRSAAKTGDTPGLAGIWLQFYSGDGEAGSFGREPTAKEMEAMMYGCALKGVRAFWYFSMRPRSTLLWRHTGELVREMEALKDVFAFGRRLPFACSHPQVMGELWEHAGKLYLVTLNNGYAPAKGKINLPAPYRAGTGCVLFESRSAPYDGYMLEDSWEPLSRHVYVLGETSLSSSGWL